MAGVGRGDTRILGSGDFVSETLQQAEMKFERKYLSKRPIGELVETVAGKLGVKAELVYSRNKQRQYSEARSLVAFLAVEELGHPAAEVARYLGITRMGVQKAVMRGSELERMNPAFEN
jgi:chromosomal replication initiation ATPase DnaA